MQTTHFNTKPKFENLSYYTRFRQFSCDRDGNSY